VHAVVDDTAPDPCDKVLKLERVGASNDIRVKAIVRRWGQRLGDNSGFGFVETADGREAYRAGAIVARCGNRDYLRAGEIVEVDIEPRRNGDGFFVIERLDYARYFLTVHDIVRFARQRGILCQGRGSAANSVVCYCLGITAVDPARIDVLFERFISSARNEPPDIDVDFEHERREEVIQYLYDKYGRDRAGLAATVICYRSRSAIREVGKALGLSVDVVAALAGIVWGWSNDPIADQRVREAGLDPTDRTLRRALDLAAELVGFPRHLSQHVGGFVITRGPLSELVAIENAAMEDRTVIEWDKDDLDRLGILKIDVLALGMLTCIRKAVALIEKHYGRQLSLATVPPEEPAVYEMLSRADSLGVFQVESRAQMSMLPRLKPQQFYDLVIEVAIVRPGPIQGDMVHPYLRRRSGKDPVELPFRSVAPSARQDPRGAALSRTSNEDRDCRRRLCAG
jgi:error-prone DNA polymerase